MPLRILIVEDEPLIAPNLETILDDEMRARAFEWKPVGFVGKPRSCEPSRTCRTGSR